MTKEVIIRVILTELGERLRYCAYDDVDSLMEETVSFADDMQKEVMDDAAGWLKG